MTKLGIVALFLFLIAHPVFAADPLEGTWRTSLDENGYSGVIVVAPCGDVLCGRLITSFDDKGNEFKSEFNGKNILSETVAGENGTYRGRAFSPDRRKTYNSRLQLNGDVLNVRGCILGICRDGGTWARIN